MHCSDLGRSLLLRILIRFGGASKSKNKPCLRRWTLLRSGGDAPFDDLDVPSSGNEYELVGGSGSSRPSIPADLRAIIKPWPHVVV